jgi:hypothetical protein
MLLNELVPATQAFRIPNCTNDVQRNEQCKEQTDHNASIHELVLLLHEGITHNAA